MKWLVLLLAASHCSAQPPEVRRWTDYWAAAYGVEPELVHAVIEAESGGDPNAVSSAGAAGVMQLMPATGAQIVSQIGWPVNYDEKDLYRPNVSITLGTHYLGTNRDLLDGDLYATLAAYNGGPGNALEWQRLSQGDPDLFLESVRFEETRNYIRNIYEIYTIYRRLYGVE